MMTVSSVVRMMALMVVASILIGLVGTAGTVEKIDVLIGFHDETKASMLTSFGAEITHEFQLMPVVAARLSEPAITILKANPAISFIERDSEVSVCQQVTPWGIQRIRALEVHADNITGAGVKVAVLDTGIDLTHPDLQVCGGANFVGGQSWDDDHGHGTHVAGTIAALDNNIDVIGVAPDVELYSVKVLDQFGGGTWAGVAQGIEWAIMNNMDIINMSLGGGAGSIAVETACQNAWNAGILIVAAAGNNGAVNYPALYDTVMAVGATDENDNVPWWSGAGPELEITAPGVDVLSTAMGGGTTTFSGTSMAAPHVAGVAALLWSFRPDLTNGQVRDQLNEAADPVGDPYIYGSGIVDAYRTIPGLIIDVWTNQTTYNVGQLVQTHITVVDRLDQPIAGQRVNVAIFRPDFTIYVDEVTTDGQGHANHYFYPDIPGEYIIHVQVNRTGYIGDSKSTTILVQ